MRAPRPDRRNDFTQRSSWRLVGTGAYRPLRMSEYGEIDPRAGLGDCSCGHPFADHEWTSDGAPICSEGCECPDLEKDAQASEGDSGGR
jgi:hypothetical protein